MREMWSRLRLAVPRHASRVLAGAAAGVAAYAIPPYMQAEAEPVEFDVAEMNGQRSFGTQTSGSGYSPGSLDHDRRKTIAEASEELSRARKRVAVFGGSFNPITNAHLNCAAEISKRRQKILSEPIDATHACGTPLMRLDCLSPVPARSPFQARGRGVDHAVRCSSRQTLASHSGAAPAHHVPPGGGHDLWLAIRGQGVRHRDGLPAQRADRRPHAPPQGEAPFV